MYRFLPVILLLPVLAAQPPALDKPPQDVDDALRARIKQFYDYHVEGKYRQAEKLIADESQDDFYVSGKPELKSYKIGNIEYSDGFKKAKAVIVGSVPVLLPMAGGKIMDMPFASYWKMENGLWYFYYNKEVSRMTPFGTVKAHEERKPGEAPATLPQPPPVTLESLQSALKIDRTKVVLVAGKPQTVKVTNTLPGPASLSVACPYRPLAETGVSAKFDKPELKANETATLTFDVDPNVGPGVVPVQITVSPTNQVLSLTINVTRE
jgi:hypothetical protein